MAASPPGKSQRASMTFSVIVPSERPRALAAALQALGEQAGAPPFRAVVVLDGTNEGAAAAVVAQAPPGVETILLEQSRRGLHHARDLGASAARGDVLLFIDEDYLPEPALLADLAARHEEGAGAVQAAISEAFTGPATVASGFAARWMADRRARLATGDFRPPDTCVAPLSMRRDVYVRLREKIGPPGFSRAGVGEDFRLGHGLNALGVRVDYLETGCRAAGIPTPDQLLAKSHEIGRADAELSTGSPDLAASVARARHVRWATGEREHRAVAAAPPRARTTAADLRSELLGEARRGRSKPDAPARFDRALALQYWLGHDGHAGLPL